MRDRDTIRGWALAGADAARSQRNRRESGSRLAVEVWNGFVMVNRDRDALPLAPQLAPLTAHLEPYALHDRIQLDVHEVTASWDWKLSMEHFNLSMEAYRNGVLSQELVDAVEVDPDGVWSLLYGLARSRGRGRADIFPICEDLPPEYRTRINVINVFPTLHLVTDATIALWIQLHVEGPRRHLLRWSLLLPERSLAVAKMGGRLDHYCEILRVLLEDDLQMLTRASEPREGSRYVLGAKRTQVRAATAPVAVSARVSANRVVILPVGGLFNSMPRRVSLSRNGPGGAFGDLLERLRAILEHLFRDTGLALDEQPPVHEIPRCVDAVKRKDA